MSTSAYGQDLPRRRSTRVFVAGLPRTGTTSLHLAFLVLGRAAIHRPARFAQLFFEARFSELSGLPFDCYSDLPVPIYFRELHRTFPDAKFILPVRDTDSWLESIEKFLAARPPNPAVYSVRDALRLALFGTTVFHAERFERIYTEHNASVRDYFGKAPGKLLHFSLAGPTAWAPLCEFLGEDIPETAFPRIREPDIGKFFAVDHVHAREAQAALLKNYHDTGQYIAGPDR